MLIVLEVQTVRKGEHYVHCVFYDVPDVKCIKCKYAELLFLCAISNSFTISAYYTSLHMWCMF